METTGRPARSKGKAFWLLQRLGLATVANRIAAQETRTMKAAVAHARAGDYAASLSSLDKVTDGASADVLAAGIVSEWTRLSAVTRAFSNLMPEAVSNPENGGEK